MERRAPARKVQTYDVCDADIDNLLPRKTPIAVTHEGKDNAHNSRAEKGDEADDGSLIDRQSSALRLRVWLFDDSNITLFQVDQRFFPAFGTE